MKYTYIVAYCAKGIVHAGPEVDTHFWDDQAHGIQVLLTADSNPHLLLLSRHAALMSLMLGGMMGDPLPTEFSARLGRQIEEVEQQRLAASGAGPVLLIKITGDTAAEIPPSARKVLDFVVCFDAFDKKALRAQLQSKVAAILTGLRIGAGAELEFRHIIDGIYLTTPDGKVVHSASVELGNADLYVSRRLTAEQISAISNHIPLALQAHGLERVLRLYAHSLNESVDNYRSFLAAWAALEILIGKLFPIYHDLLAAELLRVRSAPGLHAYLTRIASVMADKHSLSDKFAVLSVYLDHDGKSDEVRVFRNLKDVRNRLFHGEELDEAMLPTQDIQCLFDKYLRNHLRRGD